MTALLMVLDIEMHYCSLVIKKQFFPKVIIRDDAC